MGESDIAKNLGAGVVPWGSDESARFRARSGKAELYSQALDFLQHRGDLTQDTRSQIPVTSFKRLIEAPDIRSRIGVELIDGHLYRLAPEDRVAKAMVHIINDLTHNDRKKRITVKDIYTKEQRQEYAKRLPSRIVVRPTIKSGQGKSLTEGDESPPPSKRKARIQRPRDKLVPKDCVLSIPNPRIHEIEIELRKLSLDNHTNAVSVLFRVFMELSVDDYIETNSLTPPKDAKLHAKIQIVANDLSSRKKLTKKQLSPVRTAIQKNSLLAPSVTTMHDYIHNAYVFPAPSDLRASWNNLQPFFTAIWSPQ